MTETPTPDAGATDAGATDPTGLANEPGWSAKQKERWRTEFVKQLPIDGKLSKDPGEWPEDLRIREFPNVR